VERTNSGVLLLIVYLLLAVYLFPFYPESGSLNELTDWATTASLVESNTFDISAMERIVGGRFESVERIPNRGVYSTKPPGLALISAPFYAITRTVLGAPTSGNIRTSWYVLRLVFGTMPLLLLAIWLNNREVDSYSMAVLLFATPMLPYSMLYYRHVFVAIIVYMSFRLMYDVRRAAPETCFSAAFLLGVAILCDYTAVVPTIVFGIGMLTMDRIDKVRRILFFATGILAPLAALFSYYFFVFGSPLAILDQLAVSVPGFGTVGAYLFSPSHGLLVFSPVFILAVLALPGSDEAGVRRQVVKIAAVVLTFIAVCTTEINPDGTDIGPRHLIIIMPFLLDSFFDGEIEEYPSNWRGIIFSVSFVFASLPLLTHAFAPAALRYPHNSYWIPLLIEKSVFGQTLANTFDAAISFWTILPAALLLMSALFLVWRDAKYRVSFGIGIFVGFAIAAAYFFTTRLEPDAAAKFVEQVQAFSLPIRY